MGRELIRAWARADNKGASEIGLHGQADGDGPPASKPRPGGDGRRLTLAHALASAPADMMPAVEPTLRVELAHAAPGDELTVIQAGGGWRLLPVREVWRYRELLYFFIWRDIKVQYKQTVLGAAWAVWNPVLNMVIFSLLFGYFAKAPSDGVAYPVFVYAGLLPWSFFATSVTQASLSLVNQTHLVTKTYFPRVLMPLTGVGTSLVNIVPAFGVYVVIMAWYGHVPGITVLLFPALMALAGVTALGVGLVFASATLSFRDFRHLVPSLVQAWMFLSPVVYAESLVPERYRWLMLLNPMTGTISAIRGSLLGLPMDLPALGVSAGLGLALLIVGLAVFHRTERGFADIA